MPRPTMLAPLALVVLLGACSGGGDDPGADASTSASPSASATSTADAACGLLSEGEVSELAGRELAGGRSGTAGTLPVCVWGSLSHIGVQVGAMPADEWARGLPEAVAQLKESGLADDPENTRRLEAAAELVESGNEISPGRACVLFSALLEASGAGPGQDRALTVVPSSGDPKAITGQTCRDGTFVSVLLTRPDFTAETTEAVARRVEAAREQVLSRTAR